MSRVKSESDFVFKVTLTAIEVAKLKKQASWRGVRYADYVCEVIKHMVNGFLEVLLSKE